MMLSGDYKNKASATYRWGVVLLTLEGDMAPGPGYWFKTQRAAREYARHTWRFYAIARRA